MRGVREGQQRPDKDRVAARALVEIDAHLDRMAGEKVGDCEPQCAVGIRVRGGRRSFCAGAMILGGGESWVTDARCSAGDGVGDVVRAVVVPHVAFGRSADRVDCGCGGCGGACGGDRVRVVSGEGAVNKAGRAVL